LNEVESYHNRFIREVGNATCVAVFLFLREVVIMTGAAHLAAGGGLGSLIGLGCGHPLAGLVGGGLAGLLADIDHPGSTLGRYVRKAAVRLEEGHGHRAGFTHTVFFALAGGLLAGLFVAILLRTWPLIFAGVMGSFSHLFLDATTRSGIQPFRLNLPKLKPAASSGGSRWLLQWARLAGRWNRWAGQVEARWGGIRLNGPVATGDDWREVVVIIGGWLLAVICIFVVS